MVKISVVMCVSTVCLFLFVKNPMGIAILLFLLSLIMVFNMGFLVSTWYAYMLFLVYIGGLLVMFIYICMISSNYRFSNKFSLWKMTYSMVTILLSSQYVLNQKLILYLGLGINGVGLPLSLFLILGVYLLICFLAIINIIFSGGASVKLVSS